MGTSRADLIAQAKASTETMRPASLQELGITPGQDFAPVLSRRHAPAAEREPDLLDDLDPQQRRLVQAEAVRLGTQAGEYGPANEHARGAQDHAALVADLLKSGAYTTSVDGTPGRRVATTNIAGHTSGHGGQ